MTKRDFYEILGVPRNAPTEEIKKAYRTLALKYHPDRNQGDTDSEEKFKEASEAYSVLGNDEKRQIYDQYGHEGLQSGSRGFSDFSFFSDSIFSDFEDILGNFFGFGSPFSSKSSHQRGHDIGVEISLTMEEAYKGIEKTFDIEKEINCDVCKGSKSESGQAPETCKQCGGSGKIRRSQGFFSISTPCPVCKGSGRIITHPCKKCQGSGRISEIKEMKITFPPGVKTGNKMRVAGEGEDGLNGGRPGDLYILIDIEEDYHFKRQDNDLIYELNISFSQAALGDALRIKTFYGTETIKIPPETQNNEIIKVKGKGFKNVNGWGKGDFLVIIKVETPRKLTRKEKELFKELRKIEKEKNKSSGEKDLSI
ncbi:MAG: molecular chaperone DnaJ [Candidatus Aminicenantes bacterium]|nr:molecular chaperone DnaJ [Candidatus Aminicenantes bacterium]